MRGGGVGAGKVGVKGQTRARPEKTSVFADRKQPDNESNRFSSAEREPRTSERVYERTSESVDVEIAVDEGSEESEGEEGEGDEGDEFGV